MMIGNGYDVQVIRQAYEEIAPLYLAQFGNQLDQLDLDREMLDLLARHGDRLGPILDIGCGPGEVAEYLTSQGAPMVGVDLTPGMLTVARQQGSDPRLLAANLRHLPVRDHRCGGAAAFYVLHHLPRWELDHAFQELRRALRTGAPLLLATHAGQGEFYAKDHNIRGTLYSGAELATALAKASFRVDTLEHRDPLPHERQCAKLYVFARSGGSITPVQDE